MRKMIKMSTLFSRPIKVAGLSASVLTLATLPVFAQNSDQVSTVQTQRPVGFVPLTPPTRFSVSYSGSLFILPIGELAVTGSVTSRGYSMRSDMKTTGFGKLTKSGGIWSTSIGFYDDTKMRPSQHVIQRLNEKGRRTTIYYDNAGNPKVTIKPSYGSMGQPPATDEERRGALDAQSAIMKLMMIGHKFGDKPCTGSLPVFDGKQRYNLRLEYKGIQTLRQSSYRGEAVRCNVYLEAVSGYDPEDVPTKEEGAAPLEIYMVNFEEAGLYLPVRFDYRISGVKVNIRATDIKVTTG